jgi:cell wall-associated NlpC family hydrolase
LAADTPPARQYFPIIRQASAKYGVPADLLAAQLQSESNFNPNARSPAGALGIAQFMPGTAKGFGIDPLNPNQAIDAAAKYDSRLNQQLPGGWNEALAGYNAGPGAVTAAGGIPNYPETQNYVRTVNARRARFPGLATSTPPSSLPLASAAASPERQPAGVPIRTALPNTGGGAGFSLGSPSASSLAQQLIDSSAKNAGIAPLNLGDIGNYQAPSDTTVPVQQLGVSKLPLAKGPAGKALTLAKEYLGTPYQWGGTTPKGFDCSGYVQYVYGKAGVELPRTTYQQIKVGQPVDLKSVQAGDIVFFGTPDNPHHEGMAIGGGKFIHAPHTGDVVKVSSLSDPYYAKAFVTARRVA